MNRRFLIPALLLPLGLPPIGRAAERCSCQFEVSAASGTIRPVRRATATATDRTCTFDVRLRVAQQQSGACDGASARLRSATGTAESVDPWAMPWKRVTMRARKHGVRRQVWRARISGSDGAVGRARLALRCAAEPTIEGCDGVLAEPSYCHLGGLTIPRVVGLTSGSVCGVQGPDSLVPLLSPSFAAWQGNVWMCGVDSPMGAFVAVPISGGDRRRVAGPCDATGTDGEALLVLPRPGFDDPLPPVESSTTPLVGPVLPTVPHGREIRAYDLPDDVPAGPYRVVFDLDTIPDGSPCGAMVFDTITAQDGIVYAAGCEPGMSGCMPQSFVCVFDTKTGAVRPRLVLEDFSGRIRGLSALPGGRLVVLTDDVTVLPPIGYGDPPPPGSQSSFGDKIHTFDVTDGSRLDTVAINASGAQGLSCVSH
jgi:hypothetical protein